MSILIKNCQIITAEENYFADIYIEQEKVTTIGTNLSMSADREINANGKYVIPGGIDVHTHLDMPLGNISSSDDFETGTRAAAYGGTTTIIDYATQSKGMRMRGAFDIWRMKAEGKACIDYGFHMIVTDLSDDHFNDMDELVSEGITSFKFFMAYPNLLMVDDATILKAMNKSAENGGLICIHAEDGYAIDAFVKKAIADNNILPIYHALTRPTKTEADAVQRTIVYIVHVSSYDALRKIIEAQEKGIEVFAETCPQYLFLSIEDLEKPYFEGAKYVLTPPLREKFNQEKLWEGIINNHIQIVSTDHCPFNFKGQKELGKNDFTKIPNGGPGIENRMQLIFEGGVNQKRISLNRWVAITSTNPAKLFGLFPRKGKIAVGSDADIIIWNPNINHIISARTHHMRVDYSMYEGFSVGGNAEIVLSRGEVIINEGKWIGKSGRGKFIKRDTYQRV
jgi:dihydropyrimidinase